MFDMATHTRKLSIDKQSQFSNVRSYTGSQAPSLHSQQQSQPSISRAISSQSHQAPVSSNNNPSLLNTELRAQARKEREATRERSKEKMQQPMNTTASVSLHSGFHNRERSASVMSGYQGSEKRISPKILPKPTVGGQPTRTTVSRHSHKKSIGPIVTNENQPLIPSQHVAGRMVLQPIQASFQDRQGHFAMEDNAAQRQHFSDLASRIPSPPKGEEIKSDFDSMQTTYIYKYYYDMVEKCQGWQRYASNMKTKAETLDIENRILKEINEKQDREIQSLEMEVSSLRQQQYPVNLSASHTFPPADVVGSSALTIQALAAMNRSEFEHSLPTSISVPQLPSQVWDRPLSPSRIAKRQVSEGEALFLGSVKQYSPQSYDGHESGNESEDERKIQHLNLPNVAGNQGLGLSSTSVKSRESSIGCEEDEFAGQTSTRGGSALSDAMTVTGDYLQDIVEQKRQLRKASLSQQQQLHYLQARIHLNSNASQSSLISGLGGGGGSSRPSSRLSNHGARSKVRSRAGSYTMHDSIPVAKDDVFSSQGDDVRSSSSAAVAAPAPTKRAGSTMPLGVIDLNNRGSQSDLSDASECLDNSSFAKATKMNQKQQDSSWSSPSQAQLQSQEGSLIKEAGQSSMLAGDSDPKGAHRRLYIRLRDELETADLVRFERYVHRYDALEIGIDGSRGIINRVRRLLLSEELVRSKATQAEKYRFRKELAREFERIVREDAIPKEGDSQTLQDVCWDAAEQQEATKSQL